MSIFLLFFLLKKRISWGFCCKRSTISCWLISCFFWFSCFHAKKEKEKIQWNEHDSCIYLSLKDRNIISFFYISMEFNIFDGRLFREVYVFKCRLEIRVNSSKDQALQGLCIEKSIYKGEWLKGYVHSFKSINYSNTRQDHA